MSNYRNPNFTALWDVFGAVNSTPHFPNTTIASASGEGHLSDAPAFLYGIAFNVSANNTAIDIRLIDATATSILTPVNYQLRTLQLGTQNITFPRPIKFDKGIMWQITATGTATPQLYYFWSPRGDATPAA